jgi:hypothetical protein
MHEPYIKFYLAHKTNHTKSSKCLQYQLMLFVQVKNSTNWPQDPAIGRLRFFRAFSSVVRQMPG